MLKAACLTCRKFHQIITSNKILFNRLHSSPTKWRPGPNYDLSEDRLSVIKRGQSGVYDCSALGPSLLPGWSAEWQVRASVGASCMMIGVAPKTINQTTSANFRICGWYMYLSDCSRYSQNNTFSSFWTGCKIKRGDLIKVRLDLTKSGNGELFFSWGTKDFELAYGNLPTDQPLYLTALMALEFDTVQLVKQNKQ
eukprot:TRINITY_DN5935_c0_g1_i2.p1 TRINITY_DN5935_c0_g1~~TRINITY_DN5935_c0_g1_i2.p1  ORF type:complete len:227 (-),score=23.62 TRINITY_DN5935_c0_g1_i2:71-658(-)